MKAYAVTVKYFGEEEKALGLKDELRDAICLAERYREWGCEPAKELLKDSLWEVVLLQGNTTIGLVKIKAIEV